MNSTAPVIGISGSACDSASVQAIMTQIRSAGAIPLFLANHTKRDAAADFEKIDAVIFMGNEGDIDPKEYGATTHPKTNSELKTPEGAARRSYETTLFRFALTRKMPILGICGGMQRINVLLEGGTLHQSLPDLIGHDEHEQRNFNIALFVPVQSVSLVKNSLLQRISGTESVFENSMHRQAVDKIGMGLRACAYSSDQYTAPDGTKKNIIEAIEADPNGPLKDQFVMGVQWHPEFGASDIGAKLATHFTAHAHAFAKTQNRTHPVHQAIEENTISNMPSVRRNARPQPGSAVAYLMSQAERIIAQAL